MQTYSQETEQFIAENFPRPTGYEVIQFINQLQVNPLDIELIDKLRRIYNELESSLQPVIPEPAVEEVVEAQPVEEAPVAEEAPAVAEETPAAVEAQEVPADAPVAYEQVA